MPADPTRGRRRASLDVAPGFGAALEEVPVPDGSMPVGDVVIPG
jgi:hypothetical protein